MRKDRKIHVLMIPSIVSMLLLGILGCSPAKTNSQSSRLQLDLLRGVAPSVVKTYTNGSTLSCYDFDFPLPQLVAELKKEKQLEGWDIEETDHLVVFKKLPSVLLCQAGPAKEGSSPNPQQSNLCIKEPAK